MTPDLSDDWEGKRSDGRSKKKCRSKSSKQTNIQTKLKGPLIRSKAGKDCSRLDRTQVKVYLLHVKAETYTA